MKVIDPHYEIKQITNWIKEYFAKNGPAANAVIGISGGKDSTIAAALLVRALGKERVIGVMMPQNTQTDIDDSRKVCEILGIQSYEIDIGPACTALYRAIDDGFDSDSISGNNYMVKTNTPARIRMATLYAIAAMTHGRVCNTSNNSEKYVGYSTKWGDGVGDFGLFRNYTVRDVLAIGAAMDELPKELVFKPAADGMSGKTDEDNLGFTYEELDAYILDGEYPSAEKTAKIVARNKGAQHKVMTIPCPGYPRSAHEDTEDWSEAGLEKGVVFF